MHPPFAPYIPLNHPDDLLPIERTALFHRTEKPWLYQVSAYEQKHRRSNVRYFIAQLGNRLIVIGRRLEQIGMTSPESSDEHRLSAA